MKLSVKTLLATVALTVLFVTPVFATETNIDKEMTYINNHVKEVGIQISSYLTTDDGCGPAAKLDHGTHATVVDGQILNWVADEEVNYIKYLQGVVVNKKETERIKKEILDNYVNLGSFNGQFAAMIPAATADYNAAVADRMATENEILVSMNTFANFNAQLNAVICGGIIHNAIIDK